MRAWGQFFIVLAVAALLFVPMFARSVTPPLAYRSAPATNTPRAVAWVNHSIQKVAMVAAVVRLDRTTAAFPMTRFEREVRRKMDFHVEWVSAKEGQVVRFVQRVKGRTVVRLVK